DTRVVGALDDPVVDVRIVLHERDAIALEGQIAANHVEDYRAARVADVGVVVHGHPAHVHADFARCDRDEVLLRPGHRVGDPDHAVTSTLTTPPPIAPLPSRRPPRPSPSGLSAFTLTRSTSRPSVSARRLAISGSSAARRGAWASTVASTFTSRPPRAATRSATFRRSRRLEMPR